MRPEICNVSFDEESNKCVTGEDKLISVIKEQPHEIGSGEPNILTCKTYDAIKRNAPNMMFMHYKQVDKLQQLISKHYCPNLLNGGGALHVNVGAEKTRTATVKVGTKEVPLEEWVKEKSDLLSYALELRDVEKSCQSSTRQMEDELFGCETEFVRWSPNDMN